MEDWRRRAVLAGLGALTPGSAAASTWYARRDRDGWYRFPTERSAPLDFSALIERPVRIRSVEQFALPDRETILIRALSEDGVEGVVRASTKAEGTVDLFKRFVAPKLVGQDARDLFDIVEKGYRRDYEWAGLPYWSAFGQAEVAVWDLLGKTAGKRCAEMIGPVLREQIPVYMSSNKRDTEPAEEIAHLQQRVGETGARAIKLKVGRRMGLNSDAKPGRSEAVIALARKTFGDAMTIYADANGAYDAPTALEVATMLDAHGVALFEEPCPNEDYAMTAQAAAAIRRRGLKIKVAGGEQDYSLERWRWYCEHRVFDVVQPDPMYAGGIFRNLAIQRLSQEAGLLYGPHFPRNGADTAPLLHLCAVAPNTWGFQEYRSRPDPMPYAHAPVLEPLNGELALPSGPGWGVTFDPAVWRTATRL